jgi:hypothetical protein
MARQRMRAALSSEVERGNLGTFEQFTATRTQYAQPLTGPGQ